MKMGAILVFVYLTCIQYSALAQHAEPVFADGDTSFSTYMSVHARVDDLALCDRELLLIRFKIDQEGQVTAISFSSGADSGIKAVLRNALESTGGKWRPGSDSGSLKSYFVLPCLIGIENGCNQKVINAYFKSGDSARQILPMGHRHNDSLPPFGNDHPQKKRQLSDYWAHKSFVSMSNLLVFDDDKPGFPMNCILLPQIDFVYLH